MGTRRRSEACGCQSAAAALLASVLGYPILLYLRLGELRPPSATEIIVGLTAVLTATLAGKIAGLVRGKRVATAPPGTGD